MTISDGGQRKGIPSRRTQSTFVETEASNKDRRRYQPSRALTPTSQAHAINQAKNVGSRSLAMTKPMLTLPNYMVKVHSFTLRLLVKIQIEGELGPRGVDVHLCSPLTMGIKSLNMCLENEEQ